MTTRLTTHPWLLWAFTRLWEHRLRDNDHARVLRVKGWRTALIETRWGQRATVTWL